MKPLIIIGLLQFFAITHSCKKDLSTHFYSKLNVRVLGDEEDILMETVEGSYDKRFRLAKLQAHGYKFEQFDLYLPFLSDTGFYTNPSISNISFTDGVDFIPIRLRGGFIHIKYIDSTKVRGDFRVTLDDEFNGAEVKTIIGGFEINTH